MRFKIAIIALMLTVGTIFSFSQDARSADVIWANVTIDKVYYHKDGRCEVRFSEVDNIFTNKAFMADGENSKAILAVILTAESLDKVLRVAFYDGTPATIIMAGINNN